MMSGLPGSGKDHWIRENLPDWPMISLDEVRAELGIDPSDDQGKVLEEARRRAKEFLRAKTSFVWNATNLSGQLRGGLLDLFANYGARIRIVYIEVPACDLLTQNRQRDDTVPERVLEKMFARWEVPDLTEAHRVDWIVRE